MRKETTYQIKHATQMHILRIALCDIWVLLTTAPATAWTSVSYDMRPTAEFPLPDISAAFHRSDRTASA